MLIDQHSSLIMAQLIVVIHHVRVAHYASRLQDLNMWPSVSGRKTVGTLEAHTNGLRFVSNKGEKVEIIYANIAHGVFQPCDREHVVLIHFHLKHAIMIGKKKYRDVQFFTEVVEASQVRLLLQQQLLRVCNAVISHHFPALLDFRYRHTAALQLLLHCTAPQVH